MNKVKVRFSLYKYGEKLPHPRDIPAPAGSKKVKWESHPIVDSIHITYEFDDESSKYAFIDNPPSVFSEAKIDVIREKTTMIAYGDGIRDDTAAMEAHINGTHRVVNECGVPITEAGGVFLIKGTIEARGQ